MGSASVQAIVDKVAVMHGGGMALRDAEVALAIATMLSTVSPNRPR